MNLRPSGYEPDELADCSTSLQHGPPINTRRCQQRKLRRTIFSMSQGRVQTRTRQPTRIAATMLLRPGLGKSLSSDHVLPLVRRCLLFQFFPQPCPCRPHPCGPWFSAIAFVEHPVVGPARVRAAPGYGPRARFEHCIPIVLPGAQSIGDRLEDRTGAS